MWRGNDPLPNDVPWELEVAEVCAALGLSSTEPLTNLRVLREGEEVIEAEWRKAALAIITEYRNFIHRGDPAECAAGDAEDDIRLIRAEWNGTLGIIHAESVVAGCPNPTGEPE